MILNQIKNDGENGSPPQLRDDLLSLHQLAMSVNNKGSRSKVTKLFESAVDLEDVVYDMIAALEQVKNTPSLLARAAAEEPGDEPASRCSSRFQAYCQII